MRLALIAGSIALVAVLGTVGCSDQGDEGIGGASAFTFENGARFVVSAQPDKIVLRKNVDGTDLPFTQEQLQDKALLIFPVDGVTIEEGVFSRANSVTDDGDRFTITSTPLTYDEIEAATEDEIVRIFTPGGTEVPDAPAEEGTALVAEDAGAPTEDGDPSVVPEDTTDTTDTTDETTRPQAFGIHPLAVSAATAVAFPGFNFDTGLALFGTPIKATSGVTVTHTVSKASVRPRVFAEFGQGNGVEIGFKGDVAWRSSIAISGNLSAASTFFKSQEVKTPPLVIPVPNPSGIPVPVTFRGSASVSCTASASGAVNVTVDVDATANVAGSVKVDPHANTAPSTWMQTGRWPFAAGGSAKVTKKAGANASVKVECGVPRIELSAKIANVVGPFIAVTPTAVLDTSGLSMETRISAGVKAGMLGASVSAEMPITSFKSKK